MARLGALLVIATAVAIAWALIDGSRDDGRDAPAEETARPEPPRTQRSDRGPRCFDPAAEPAGARPPACWRPFADGSPFNRRLPDAPPLLPGSDAIVAAMAANGPPPALKSNAGGTSADFGHPLYFARYGDPEYVIRCTAGWSPCEPEGRRFLIPKAAKPAGHLAPAAGMDRHLSVAQPDGTVLDLWRAATPSGGGGVLSAAAGGISHLDGHGLGSNATAAMFGAAAGTIRAQELAAGRIDHALFAVVPCTTGHVYPAGKGAAECSDRLGPPNGARLQLDLSPAELAALDVPPWKRAVLTALVRYGMIVGDTGGSGGFGLQFESGMVDRAYGRPEAIDRYASQAGLPRRRNLATGRLEHVFDVASHVDWANRLRVVHPCVSAGTCGPAPAHR